MIDDNHFASETIKVTSRGMYIMCTLFYTVELIQVILVIVITVGNLFWYIELTCSSIACLTYMSRHVMLKWYVFKTFFSLVVSVFVIITVFESGCLLYGGWCGTCYRLISVIVSALNADTLLLLRMLVTKASSFFLFHIPTKFTLASRPWIQMQSTWNLNKYASYPDWRISDCRHWPICYLHL